MLSTENSLIKIKKLDVVYFLGKSNETTALKDINLDIYPGEFIIFFGPSGCGKSTLLYSIAGLETNIQGNIYTDEKDLGSLTSKEVEKYHQSEVGMIFQAYYLINSLSVLDNVILPQLFLKGSGEERTKKAFELLEHFGVKEQAHKLPNELSGGQQQRVAICRSLMNDPTILLADEPVGNLDSTSADEVMSLLRDLNEKQKKTVILVTHNPAHLDYAHRVFYMKDGRIMETKVNKAINRTVASEQEVEVGMTISKELELLARTYSNISSNQAGNLLLPFKAKEIVSEVLIGMTAEDISKVEKKVENLLMMDVGTKGEIYSFLDIDENKGGMGLNKKTADNLADKIISIVNEIRLLKKEEEKLKKGKMTASSEVMQIRHYLIDSFDLNIKRFSSLEILDRAIKDRLENKIDRRQFQDILDNSHVKNGVGVDKRSAKKISKRLELLILGKYS